jgi:peptidyl-prolyl cis-trans isomerase B (cyclophilin B)
MVRVPRAPRLWPAAARQTALEAIDSVDPPAPIVFGHAALHQIKRTGEQGAGLALAGLILGWAAVILAILIVGVAIGGPAFGPG